MLTLAVFGGASTLSAQDIAGTWYFTGYVQETNGTESSYKAKRTESTVTFAPSATAGAYLISFLWDANRTTLVSFEQKSANIWLKSFNGTEPNSGTAANLVKLVRIDDDTFLFYQARQLKDATGKLLRIESISGVLTAAVLPAKRDANWPGHFLTTESSFSASTDSIAPEDDGISYDEYHITYKSKKYTVAAYGNYSEDFDNDGVIDSNEFFAEDEVEKIAVKTDGNFLLQKGSEHQKSGSASLAIIVENSLFQLSDGRLGGISAGFSSFKYSSDSAAEWGIYGTAVVLLPQGGASPTPTDPAVNPDPIVTTPPVPTATVTAGKSLTLKVVVKPAGDKTAKQLTYQWYDGTGAAIIG
ncbi:MAG: hypothetical protein LBV28_00705, partial [Puniceicoccales bacterium]|nr:hypothetical protein [Puniceicoccales bacterium]